MTLIDEISLAFRDRTKPCKVVPDVHPPTDEYADAEHFSSLQWEQADVGDWGDHYAAIFGFAPSAFCYFLPSLMIASMRSESPLIVASSLVSLLDRSNSPSSWDSFFLDRFGALTPRELSAMQSWVLWLATNGASQFSPGSLDRAFDTLEVLLRGSVAIPLAARFKGD